METTVPIPRNIYESIQDVLQSHIDSLARDIAKTLDVNEKILLHEIRKEKIGIYLIDEDNDFNIFNDIHLSSNYFNIETFVSICRSEKKPHCNQLKHSKFAE